MNKVQSDLSPLQESFVESAAELAASLSLSRSVGQIYALLYVSAEPLSLDEICRKLRISKGNGSMNLRVLEEWEAVERVWIRGERGARYVARTDLRRIALKRIEEGARRRLALARERLDRVAGSIDGRDPHAAARLKELRSFLSSVEKAVALLPKLERLARLAP